MRSKHKHTAVPGDTFSERVVKLAFEIPFGKVSTYGRIARAAGGGAMSAQSITNVLGKAWDKGVREIPYRNGTPFTFRRRKRSRSCGSSASSPFHRIVYADGRIWISPERRKERMMLYKKEGIEIDKNDRVKNFAAVLFEFW